MSEERRPGPFDDIMGSGSTPPRREPPQQPEPSAPRNDPFASPPPTPEPPSEEVPQPPQPEPPPPPPSSDPFATAPAARPARPQEDLYATRATPTTRPPVQGAPRRRDPLPYIIGGVVFVLALLVFALFLPPFELLASDDDGDSSQIADVCNGVQQSIQEDIPTIPQNLVQESPLRELTANETPCGPLNITLNLNQQTDDPNNLGFYTFDDGLYRKIADATLTTDGTAAQGQLEILPENVIVLRATGSFIHVEGTFAGGAVDPAGAELLDVLNPVSYSPATVGDGTLVGQVDAPTGNYAIVPVIRADVQEEVIAVENILQTDVSTETHVTSIATQINELDLAGIELEYGCFGSSLSQQFTDFLVALNAAIAEEKRISIVVPDPVSCANFGPYALRDIADVADFIKLTPVRDQSIYREATIEMLRNALSTGVPRAKLLLVVSAYSTVRDPAGAALPINARDALAIAALPTLVEGEQPLEPGTDAVFRGNRIDPSSGATGIGWDEQSMTVSFSYESEGTFTYWLENSFSIPFKLDLVSRFQIAGIAIDDASDVQGLADVWLPVSQYKDSGAPTLLSPNPAAFALEWRVDGATIDNEVGPSFRWTVTDQAGGQCSFGPTSAVDHCITLIVSDAELRVGTELRVEVAGVEGEEGEEDGEATATATPTATPEP